MNHIYGSIVALLLMGSCVYAQSGRPNTLAGASTQVGLATGYLGISLLVAHLAAPEAYSAQAHTISHLGAQGYDRAWIMNAGFVGFGGMLTASSLAHSLRTRKDWTTTVPLAVYGLGILTSGLFSTDPFTDATAYSAGEAMVHSIGAQAAGVGLSVCAVSLLVTDPNPRRKTVHGLALLFIGATSAMVGLSADHVGTWQRILWVGSLAWLNWSLATDPRFAWRREDERAPESG